MKQLALLAAAVLSVAPSYAGIVYIPVAKVNPDQGVSYETRLVLGNTGQSVRRATPTLIDVNADGTIREALEVFSQITVNPNGTTVVQDLLGGERFGLIELNMAPQLIASAHLASKLPDGSERLGAHWPIISSANAIGAGQTQHLQGWTRSATLSTDFGLVNLGTAALCGVAVVRPDGSQYGFWELSQPALSFALFRDVLAIIGISSGTQLRAEITCDQPFYGFAVITDSETHEHRTIIGSALGTSTLVVPGQPQACAEGSICWDRPGVFYQVTNSLRTVAYNVDVPKNTTYSNLTLDFDFVFTGWWGSLPTGEHNLFWINRGRLNPPTGYPAWTNNVFGYANARGPGRDRVTLVTNVNLGQNNTSFLTTNAALNPGTLYHVSYLYDHVSRVVDLKVTAGGVLVAQIIGLTTGPIATNTHDAFMVYFGNNIGSHGNEVPWLSGSQFMNAVYRMNP